MVAKSVADKSADKVGKSLQKLLKNSDFQTNPQTKRGKICKICCKPTAAANQIFKPTAAANQNFKPAAAANKQRKANR